MKRNLLTPGNPGVQINFNSSFGWRRNQEREIWFVWKYP